MKGVSAIIATILLLMITIGLAGTAYVYISGMMTGKISKAISVIDAKCTLNATGSRYGIISLVVSNDGTDPIVNSGGKGDLKILIDNLDKTAGFNNTNVAGSTTYQIAPREVAILVDNSSLYSNNTMHRALIITPSNSITYSLYC